VVWSAGLMYILFSRDCAN